MTGSPFKFLDSFKKEDINEFFGRDEEIELIYSYLHESNIILINGPSGTGKSSIVQCGLASRFEKTDWLEVFVRRRENFNIALKEDVDKINTISVSQDDDIIENLKSLFLDFLKPIYLIFDQFEEIFISGDEKERTEFFKNLRKILDEKKIPCKVIILIRERYMAQLQNYEKTIPEIFDKRIRVEFMRDDTIAEVIKQSCSKEVFDIKIEEPQDETIYEIIKNLKIGDNFVELPHLQIYLDRLWKETHLPTGNTKSKFTKALISKVGGIQEVLKVFVNERIEEVSKNLLEKFPDVKKEIINRLLINFTTDEGTKKSVTKIGVLPDVNDKKAKESIYFIIDELSKSNIGILRLEKEDNSNEDNDIYEIAHDSLAKIIHSHLHGENLHIRRVIKIIKDGHLSYKPGAFYFKRTFLTNPQLSEIDLMKDKIKENIPSNEQPSKEDWKIVSISKRYRRLTGSVWIFFLLQTFFIGYSFFSERSVKFNTDFNNSITQASSPTQKYLIAREYEKRSIFPSRFRANNNDILSEIELYPKESFYYLSIANDEPIIDIMYLKLKKNKADSSFSSFYFAVVGKKKVNFYQDTTSTKIAVYNIGNSKWELKNTNLNIGIELNDKITIDSNEVELNNGDTLKIALNKEKVQTQPRLGFNFEQTFDYTSSGIMDFNTNLEYRLDKDNNYYFSKKYKNGLLIFADNENGICRVFNTTNSNKKPTQLQLLAEEKLNFFLELTQEDYNQLLVSPNPIVQENIWQKLENEYIKNDGFFSAFFNFNKKNKIKGNLENLLKNLIDNAQNSDIYTLWTKMLRREKKVKEKDLNKTYIKYRDILEKKVSLLSEDERYVLFRFVRIQSKSGANDEHIKFLERMHQQCPNDTCRKTLLSVIYNNASWFNLYEGKFRESIVYAKKGLEIKLPAEQLYYININLAHGYLCNNQLKEATAIYKKFANFNCAYDTVQEECFNYVLSEKLNKEIMIDDLKNLKKDKIIPINLTLEASKIIDYLNK